MVQRGLVAMALMVAMGWMGSVRAEEIYRWQDHGQLHFSNVPTMTGESTGLRSDPTADEREAAPPPDAASQVSEGAPAGAEPPAARPPDYSRQVRDAQRRLRETDDALAALARARTSHAKGSEATGGVGTSADAYQSDEEKALQESRKRQEKDLQALQDTVAR